MSATPANMLADRAYEQAMDTIKVIGSCPCPVGHATFFCSCPAAMAQMDTRKDIIAKRHYYFMILELMLLDREHAWNHNGDKASHDIFVAAEGVTPKHFVRQIIHEHPAVSKMIAPSGRLKATLEATIALWIVRNKQWSEKYGDRETALYKWAGDAYPEAGPSLAVPRVNAIGNAKAGDIIMPTEATPIETFRLYEGAHGFEVFFIKGRTPYDVRILGLDLCHPDCEIGSKVYEKNKDEVVQECYLRSRHGKRNNI